MDSTGGAEEMDEKESKKKRLARRLAGAAIGVGGLALAAKGVGQARSGVRKLDNAKSTKKYHDEMLASHKNRWVTPQSSGMSPAEVSKVVGGHRLAARLKSEGIRSTGAGASKVLGGAALVGLGKKVHGGPWVGRRRRKEQEKTAGTPILEQDRKPKVKEIYKALKRDHPEMPSEMKVRIAERRAKSNPQSRKSPKHGGPAYKGPLTKVAEGFIAAMS